MFAIQKYFLSFLFLIAFLNPSFSQIENVQGRLLRPTFPGGVVELSQLPMANDTEGSHYLYESWNLGSVALKNGSSIKNTPLKYDLYQNYLELSTERGVKVIYSENISFFEWLNTLAQKEIYYNVNEFQLEDDELAGFFEIIMDGALILSSYKDVQYAAPHYNQALDAGNEHGRFILKEEFYYIDQENNAIELPKKKKKFYLIFQDNAQQIEEFIKSTRFSIKHREDLRKIFIYNNTLNEKKASNAQ